MFQSVEKHVKDFIGPQLPSNFQAQSAPLEPSREAKGGEVVPPGTAREDNTFVAIHTKVAMTATSWVTAFTSFFSDDDDKPHVPNTNLGGLTSMPPKKAEPQKAAKSAETAFPGP